MRRIAKSSLLALVFLVAGSLVTGCDRSSEPDFEEPTLAAHSIRYLKSLSTGQATRLNEEIRLEGVVTADDLFGEWDRQIVIEDQTGGLTIAIDDRALYRRFPVGTTLSISCNGLLLHRIAGRVILGTTADPYGSIALNEELIDRHIRRTEAAPTEPQPTVVTIPALTGELADCYVRIDNLHFTERGSWCEKDPTTGRFVGTTHPAEDGSGNRISLYAHSTTTYANEPLPEGNGSCYAILESSTEGFRLRIVHRQFIY